MEMEMEMDECSVSSPKIFTIIVELKFFSERKYFFLTKFFPKRSSPTPRSRQPPDHPAQPTKHPATKLTVEQPITSWHSWIKNSCPKPGASEQGCLEEAEHLSPPWEAG